MKHEFYRSELVSSTYDVLTGAANQIGGDIQFYKDCALSFGSPVLELGVGTGRVAWMLAEAGHNVVGLDLSESMLREAKTKGASLPETVQNRVELRHGDMTDFSLERQFPLVIVPFSTFNHLATATEQRCCLDAIRRHLVPGGYLVIDMFDPIYDACGHSTKSPNAPRIAQDPMGGGKVHRRSILRVNDPLTQTFKETFRVERVDKDGNILAVEEPVHTLRWTTRQEMTYLFELTGFVVQASYGDFNRSPPAYGSRQLWVVKAKSF